MRTAVLVVALLAGCRSRTELMIGVATDIRAPDVLDEVQLSVTRTSDGFTEELVSWQITGQLDQPFNLPGSYGVYAPDGNPITVQLDLTGNKNGAPVVTRRAILGLVDGQTLFYRLGLTAGCQTMQDCGSPNMSCIEGTCKDVHLDSSTFPAFTTDLVTTLTCDSGVNYIDTSTGSPMTRSADAPSCPPGQCSEGTCLAPPNRARIRSAGPTPTARPAPRTATRARARAWARRRMAACSATPAPGRRA
jgi:hypothetical protein